MKRGSTFAPRSWASTNWSTPGKTRWDRSGIFSAANCRHWSSIAPAMSIRCKSAFDYVAHGGSLVLVGHIKGDLTFSDPHFHSHEMTLIASRNATPEDFSWVIDSLRSGAINLTPWITHNATPESIVPDFPTWLDPATGVIKAMLSFD